MADKRGPSPPPSESQLKAAVSCGPPSLVERLLEQCRMLLERIRRMQQQLQQLWQERLAEQVDLLERRQLLINQLHLVDFAVSNLEQRLERLLLIVHEDGNGNAEPDDDDDETTTTTTTKKRTRIRATGVKTMADLRVDVRVLLLLLLLNSA
ncbi:hypothetical protein TYRP_019419 [Tyrophagus putrescentiae]|nr:hypothetical protein TYRP_019419 [Tyrophagus putrescentiae]